MERKILNFSKTNHALLRQWERKIDDRILFLSLRYIDIVPETKTIFIVKQSKIIEWVQKKLYDNFSINKDLHIVIDKATIVSCYYTDNSDKVISYSKSGSKFLILK